MPLKWNPIKSDFDLVNHSSLLNDDHTQYLLLAGRSGGQTAYGDTASGGNLILGSTSHATKGKIYLGSNSVYDEANIRLGIGVTDPDEALEIYGSTAKLKLSNSATNYSTIRCNGDGDLSFETYGVGSAVYLFGGSSPTIGFQGGLYDSMAFNFYQSTNLRAQLQYLDSTDLLKFSNYSGGLSFNASTTGSAVERMVVDGTTGYVGIGCTPDSPLEVVGSLGQFKISDREDNSTNKIARYTMNHYTIAEEPVGIMVASSTSTTNSISFGGGSSLVNAVTSFAFYAAANNTTTTGSAKMVIDGINNATYAGLNSSKVGVGYSIGAVLSETFNVNGTLSVYGSVAGDVYAKIQNGNNATNDTTTLYLGNSSSTVNHGYIRAKRLSSSTGSLHFGVAQGGTATDGLVLLNTKYFGNVATPAHFLDFQGAGANNMAQLLETGSSGSGAGAVMKLGSNDGSAMASGDRLGGFLLSGYDGSAQYNTAGIFAFANEDYTGSAHGTYLSFEVTADSGNSRINALKASASGITIGAGTAGVDYTLTFDGESNDGVVTWKEDERMFELDNTLDIAGQLEFSTIDEPVNAMTYTLGGPGNVDNGTRRYKVRYVTLDGETSLSPAYLEVTVTDKSTNGQVLLDNVPISPSDKVIYRRIFRGKIGVSTSSYYFVGNITDNTTTTFTDNLADADLGTVDYRNVDNVTGGNIRVDGAKFGQIATGNMGFGYYAMGGSSTLTGWYNVAFGNSVLRYCTTGTANSGFGSYALRNLTTGSYNFGLGVNAGYNITSGSYNNAIGYNALYSNQTGGNNIAIGYLSLYACTGGGNLALGTEAFRSNVTGDNGIAIGYRSAYSATDVSGAIIVGYRAMFNGTDVKYNTVIGHQSGYVPAGVIANQCTTSTKCTFLGYQTGLGSTTQRTGAIAIGANAVVDADYTCVIGGAGADAVDLVVTKNLYTTSGGRYKNTTRVTTTYTILVTDDTIYCDTDGGAFTVTLPAGVDGQTYRVVNCGSSGNDVTIVPDGAENLLGANSSDTISDSEALILTYETTEGWW